MYTVHPVAAYSSSFTCTHKRPMARHLFTYVLLMHKLSLSRMHAHVVVVVVVIAVARKLYFDVGERAAGNLQDVLQ